MVVLCSKISLTEHFCLFTSSVIGGSTEAVTQKRMNHCIETFLTKIPLMATVKALSDMNCKYVSKLVNANVYCRRCITYARCTLQKHNLHLNHACMRNYAHPAPPTLLFYYPWLRKLIFTSINFYKYYTDVKFTSRS